MRNVTGYLIRGRLIQTIERDYRFSTWENIKRFGRSPAFSTIVFYPLLSALIGLHYSAIQIPFIGIFMNLSGSAMLKLYLLYFGLLFLFIGSIMYTAFCPEFFKIYENSLEYVKSNLQVHKLVAPATDVLRFTARRLEEHGDCLEIIHPAARERLSRSICDIRGKIDTKTELDDQITAEWLIAHWHFMMRSMPLRRLAIFISYVIGLFLISMLSLVSVTQTVMSIIHR